MKRRKPKSPVPERIRLRWKRNGRDLEVYTLSGSKCVLKNAVIDSIDLGWAGIAAPSQTATLNLTFTTR